MNPSKIEKGKGVPSYTFHKGGENRQVGEIRFLRKPDEKARQAFLLKPYKSRMAKDLMRSGNGGDLYPRIYIVCRIKEDGKIEKEVFYSDGQNTLDALPIFGSEDKDFRVVITVAKSDDRDLLKFKGKSADDCLRMLRTKIELFEIKDEIPRYCISYFPDDDTLQRAVFNLNGTPGIMKTYDLENAMLYTRGKRNSRSIKHTDSEPKEVQTIRDDLYACFSSPTLETRPTGALTTEQRMPNGGIGAGSTPISAEECDAAKQRISADTERRELSDPKK